MMKENLFREDLYYRLNILQIRTPALGEHRDDIPLIIDHFIKYYSIDLGRIPPRLNRAGAELLYQYNWPGNIRQLKNIIQRLVLTSDEEIKEHHIRTTLDLDPEKVLAGAEAVLSQPADIRPLREVEAEFRRKYFKFVRQNSKTDAEAAQKLGLAPPNFHRMCRELGLK